MRRVAPLLLTAAALTAARAARGLPDAMGAPRAELRAAAAGAPQARDGRYANPLPGGIISGGRIALLGAVLSRGRTGQPAGPVPLAPLAAPAPATPLAVTWFGHSSALLEVDGRRLLVDPVWGERASPSRALGPRRLHPVPAPLAALPDVDAVLISHDHYDHLDLPTVRELCAATAAPFVVPRGLGAHLRGWGVPDGRIRELDWDGTTEVAGLTLTCAEARHFSGRGLTRNTTLWSSWAVRGPRHRVFFGGDTGYTPAFARHGARLGPFDLVLLPIGAYSHLWPDVHMTPEETVRAHADLAGRLLVPVHWATFNLGFHPWAEPVDRLCAAAAAAGVRVAVPRPGQRVDATAPPPAVDWWSAVAEGR